MDKASLTNHELDVLLMVKYSDITFHFLYGFRAGNNTIPLRGREKVAARRLIKLGAIKLGSEGQDSIQDLTITDFGQSLLGSVENGETK